VPDQIVAEWVEYQQIFSDLLKRFSASLARQAKADKTRATDQVEALGESTTPSFQNQPVSKKAELRSKAAAMRGITRPGSTNRLQHTLENGEGEP